MGRRKAAGECGLERGDAVQERVEQDVAVVGRAGLRLMLLLRWRRVGVGVGFGLLLLVLVVVRVRVGISRLICGGRRHRLLRLRRGVGCGRGSGSGSGGAEQEVCDDGVEHVVRRGGAGRGRSRDRRRVIARGRNRCGVVARRRPVPAVAAVAGRRGGIVAGLTGHFRVVWWGVLARGDRIGEKRAPAGCGAAAEWGGAEGERRCALVERMPPSRAHVLPAAACLNVAPRHSTRCVRRFFCQ
jgi:hypothetical protein